MGPSNVVYMAKSSSPSTNPWGTKRWLCHDTLNEGLDRRDSNQESALQWWPETMNRRMCWLAGSNPADESKIRSEDWADAGATVNVSVTDNRVISMEGPLLKPDWSGPRRRFLDRNFLQEPLPGTFTGPRHQGLNCRTMITWHSKNVSPLVRIV